MLNLDRKADTGLPKVPGRQQPANSTTTNPTTPRVPNASLTAEYEQYLRLPELSKLWSSKDFPNWKAEPILKPALQALEITFRLVSIVLSDPREYTDHREWRRRLESLSARQVELVAALFEDEDGGGGAPIAELSSSSAGTLPRARSSHVWVPLPGAAPVVSRTSEASLLPRLATWEKSESSASTIQFEIEARMLRCPFTLGLGEPNLAGKPNLEYDLVVRPSDLHYLKQQSSATSQESRILVAVHQILESWAFSARGIVRRIGDRIDGGEWGRAAEDSWILERIWKLMAEVEELNLLSDPDDLLRLRSRLRIRAKTGSEAVCFRSAGLVEAAAAARDLKRKVPLVLGVEVDLNGGPRVQEAAMALFHGRRKGEEGERIHLLQAFQAVEGAVKKFFFSYRQVITAVMGSLEAGGGGGGGSNRLSEMFMEPPYFPSLDAAKTFLGELWQQQPAGSSI